MRTLLPPSGALRRQTRPLPAAHRRSSPVPAARARGITPSRRPTSIAPFVRLDPHDIAAPHPVALPHQPPYRAGRSPRRRRAQASGSRHRFIPGAGRTVLARRRRPAAGKPVPGAPDKGRRLARRCGQSARRFVKRLLGDTRGRARPTPSRSSSWPLVDDQQPARSCAATRSPCRSVERAQHAGRSPGFDPSPAS